MDNLIETVAEVEANKANNHSEWHFERIFNGEAGVSRVATMALGYAGDLRVLLTALLIHHTQTSNKSSQELQEYRLAQTELLDALADCVQETAKKQASAPKKV